MFGSPSRVVRSLREVVGRGSAPEQSDAALLDRFARERDERAFEVLVRRYGRLVSAACRRVLRAGPDAEDVWQATFLTLACRAGTLGEVQALGGWLHTVAVRTALRLRADTAKRARHEARAGELRGDTDPDEALPSAARDDLRAVLDEAISRLPEKYRGPIVLCYLEGKTNEEAAELLGCPTGTVVTRLARARDRLRDGLRRRGVGVTAGVLAASLSRLRDAGATAVTAESVARASIAFVTNRAATGLVSGRVASLTEGALRAMSVNRSKVLVAVLTALCLAGAGSGILAWSAAADVPGTGVPAVERLPAETAGPTGRVAAAPNAVIKDNKAEECEDDKPKDGPKPQPRTKVEEVVTKSFKTGKAPSVVLDVFNGTIEVVADTKSTVDASLTKQSQAETKELAQEGLKNIQLDLTQDKDSVRLVAKRLREDVPNRSEGVNAVVKVPPGAVLDLRTSNGSVKLTGGTGKVVVRTTNGAISVKDAKGELHLTASNGPITATGAQGRAEAKTSNGPIDLQVEKGIVTAHTSNGAVRIRGTLAEGDHSLTTTNGGIAVTLPAAARFKFDASTVNGVIASDFSDGAKMKAGTVTLRATVGDKPTLNLTLRTTNGGIQILKEKAETK